MRIRTPHCCAAPMAISQTLAGSKSTASTLAVMFYKLQLVCSLSGKRITICVFMQQLSGILSLFSPTERSSSAWLWDVALQSRDTQRFQGIPYPTPAAEDGSSQPFPAEIHVSCGWACLYQLSFLPRYWLQLLALARALFPESWCPVQAMPEAWITNIPMSVRPSSASLLCYNAAQGLAQRHASS